jgi:pyruvate dehydrogenase (quinone)/pyruvate oxidase
MEQADTLFMIGTSFPFSDYLPKPGKATGIQLDLKPERIGLRYPIEVGLVGDSKLTLQALLPLIHTKPENGFLQKVQEKTKDWWQLMEKRGTRNDDPLKPQVIAWTLSDLLADNAVICSDSGTITTWAARYIRIRNGQLFSCSGIMASMANAVSYAVGAQVAYPDRQVIAFVGDGGFSMLMAEFATAVYYKLPIKVILLNNGSLGMIRWEQIGFLGNPEYGINFQNIDFVKFAEACGAKGYRIDKSEQVKPILLEALSTDGPVLVEAIVDPYEPIMPAGMKLEYVENFAKALARGQPNRKRIALTLYRDKIKEI